MHARLPPLNSLRVFEAVARHRSFRKAAAELYVTPAAVTHQIKALEDQLGIELFRRLPRRVELTPSAEAALPSIQQAFELMSRAVAELRNAGRPLPLTVRATPTFASRWMMPRLQRFLAANRDVDVRVLASGHLLHLAGRQPAKAGSYAGSIQQPDLDIRFAETRPEGEHVDLLFPVEVVPMCHPRLQSDAPWPLKTLADLHHHTLLHGDTREEDRSRSAWARWLRMAGIHDVDPRRGLQFDHSTLALEAAADGLGVALATPAFAAAELQRGEVVIAFPLALSLDRAYYLVTAPASASRPEVRAFREWLLAEAAASTATPAEAPESKKPRRASRLRVKP